MRAIMVLIGGVVLANIVWATFFWRPAAEATAAPAVNAATQRGQHPWTAHEPRVEGARKGARQLLLGVLDKPWASYCSDAGHQQLVDSISYYYWQRGAQMKSYGRNWGEAGRRHVAGAWSTPDDNRIERRTRETFGRGYFVIEELHPSGRAAVAELTRGERVTAKPCAG